MSISKVSFVSALSFLSLLGTLPSLVAGHGHVNSIFIGGQYHPGFPSDDPGSADPSTIAWAVNAPSNEFVNDYNSPDIICHKNARPAKNSATIAAGETVEFQWTKWPAHQGPVLDYMARCPGKCEDADKTQLEWFKIDQSGLQSLTGCNERGNTGCWALDKLIQNGQKWSVAIPSDLKAGNYVMRHEVINLDFPGQPQNYPACINLVVTGGGSSSPQGVVGTDLYTGQEPGLNFDIFNMKTADYPCPGPPVNAGGSQGESYTGDDNAAETSPETPSAPQTQPSPAASPSPATEPSPPAAPSPVTEPSSPAAPSARATEESAPVEGSDDEESECISPNLTPRAWTA